MIKVIAAAAALALVGVQTTFRAGVDGVRVDVRVIAGGRPLSGLRAADFELRDSGVPQRVESVTLEDVPLAITIALDVSESVTGVRLEHLKAATRAAIAASRPDDRVALLTFAEKIRRPARFSSDRQTLLAAVDEMQGAGGTCVYDAAHVALTMRDTRPGRSLVLLFTDGWDTASWLPAAAVVASARRSDSVVYAVSLKDSIVPLPFRVDASGGLPIGFDEEDQPRRFLQRLTDQTGGDTFFADSSKDLPQRFAAIVRDFKNRYLLTYTPEGVPESGWHPIEVSVKRSGARVTARRGYQR